MSDMDFEITYLTGSKNESHIIALLLKLQDFVVHEAKGEYNEKWKQDKIHKNLQNGTIKIEVPDDTFEEDVNRYIQDIENLIEEDKVEIRRQNTIREDDENEETEGSLDESNMSSSDGSWKPNNHGDESEMDEKYCHKDTVSSGKRKRKYSDDNGGRKEIKKKKNSKKPQGKAQEDGADHKEHVKAKGRRKISCPLVSCKANVVHLPRHMRDTHSWTSEAAKKVLLKYNIRKRKSPDKKLQIKHKDYHKRRRCPVKDCQSIVLRLPAHLQNIHKMKTSSKEYNDAMETAVVVPDHKHPMIRWKEERMGMTSTMLHDWEEQKNSTTGSVKSFVHSDEDNETSYDSDDMASKCAEDQSSEKVKAHPVLVKFEQWMQSPDGGKRDGKTVRQHSAQLLGMLKAIDDSEDINSLLDLKLVRHVFLNSYVKDKNYEAGTIKSYLMSLRHFFTFLISDTPDEVQFNVNDVNSAREKVQMWSSSYKRESSTRKWQKLEEDTLNRLTPKNIRKFEKSEAAREAIKVIGQHSDTTEPTKITQAGYTLVRDFLFTQIFTDNANRPGILADMTIADYRKMRKEDGHYVVTVMVHKTAYVHGPARIILSEKLKSWLDIFVQIIRPQVTTLTAGNVFLSWNAKSMTSGQITKAVQSVFKKAGIELKITSTSFRKAAVTKVHMDCPEFSGKLAGLMAHNEATARKYYLLAEKTKSSVEVSKKLGKLMRSEDAMDKECSDEESACVTKRNKGEGKKRAAWRDDELKKVRDIFKQELIKKTITLDVVRDRVEATKDLHGMSPRRIYDRLKKDLNNEFPSSDTLSELPQACDSLQEKIERVFNVEQEVSQFDEPTETEASCEQLSTSIVAPTERNSNFSDGEVSTVHKIFRDMIQEGKRISKVEIEKRCETSQEGRKLLEKLCATQILNRIKYERRKKRLQS